MEEVRDSRSLYVYALPDPSFSLMKEAVPKLAFAAFKGLTNSGVSYLPGVQSDYLGGSKDYLSWSLLGLLMREGRVTRVEMKRHQAQVR